MKFIHRFMKTRRSAVAVIMAVSLAPLMFLIGIAVDYTFLSQDRTQTAFAAEAAATQATRVAAATYAFEVAQGNPNQSNAAKIAIDDANVAGNLWYAAELGTLTRGTTAAPVTVTTYDGYTTGQINASAPPNFTAQVTDNTSYPPIFNPLFGRTTPWAYNSAATATSQFSYAEILLMLDTSNSMLIGADQTDIQTIEDNSVCPKFGYIADASGNNNLATHPHWYEYQAADNDQIFFNGPSATVPTVANYPGKSISDTSESCNPGYGTGTAAGDGMGTGTAPISNCALACHTTTQTFTDNNPDPGSGLKSGTFYADPYGMARREGVNLRVDVVLNATEQVIQSMANSEAVANQLSVGVYQFNADISPIATGINYGQTGGDVLPEATTNLTTALAKVDAVDYKLNPSEQAIPPLTHNTAPATGLNLASTPPTISETGNTNFSKSLNDLIAGNATGGVAGKLSASGSGATPSTPLKFMFIVTDGMQDSAPQNGGGENGGRVIGGMTSIAAEQAAAAAGTPSSAAACSTLKEQLGYTVYILYVTYYPLASNNAYYSYLENTDAATNGDFAADINASPQLLTEVPSESAPQKFADSPTGQALQACASSPSDFYQASSSSDIKTALATMLKSALASTIRLTN
jgi:hypothetical protein